MRPKSWTRQKYQPFQTNCSYDKVLLKVQVPISFPRRFWFRETIVGSGSLYFSFLRLYLFIFRQKGREGEREGEKHLCVVASHTPPYWGPGLQPRHVPWLGIEPQPFGSQAEVQSTEPHQPGLGTYSFQKSAGRFYHQIWKHCSTVSSKMQVTEKVLSNGMNKWKKKLSECARRVVSAPDFAARLLCRASWPGTANSQSWEEWPSADRR